MAKGGQKKPKRKPGPAASKVVSAIPFDANAFLVFLEDGRVVRGLLKEGEIEWAQDKVVVPGTRGPRARGSRFVSE
jgi:hypothetical protein